MAPSAGKIKAIFDEVYQEGIAQNPFSDEPERLKQFLSPNAKIHIIGQDFPYAIQSDNFETVMATVAHPMHSLLDPAKPSNSEVIRVIVGKDDPWAAVEAKTTATTKNGKPFIHEFVYLVRFDDDEKISEIRGFFDTLNVYNHLVNAE